MVQSATEGHDPAYSVIVPGELNVVLFDRWFLPHLDREQFRVTVARKPRWISLMASGWQRPALFPRSLQEAILLAGITTRWVAFRYDGWLHFVVLADGTIFEWVQDAVRQVSSGELRLGKAVRVVLDGGARYGRSEQQLEAAGKLAGWICYHADLDPFRSVRWFREWRRYADLQQNQLSDVLDWAGRMYERLRGRVPLGRWRYVREITQVEE